jgi:[acyl-carrier-protein] S-malonyltransferase
MTTAYLFPGQGSQYVGMGRDLYEDFCEARRRFDEADEVLGFALSEVMFGSGDEAAAETEAEALRQTDVTQPALLVHSLAAWSVLEARGAVPAMTAGHSLGEYSALAAAGALSFGEAVGIARERGRLMAMAGDTRTGAMAAVLGLDDEIVEGTCTDVTASTGHIVQPANFNSPGQVVVSGDEGGVLEAMKRLEELGAKKVVQLPVSGAFHSPLMEDARAGLARALAALDIVEPRCPVFLNVTGDPTRDPDEIRKRLLEQLTSPVRWTSIMQNIQRDGAKRYVEVGAGKVLSGLVKRTVGRHAETFQAGKSEDFDKLPLDENQP